jgi:hypothetical protein
MPMPRPHRLGSRPSWEASNENNYYFSLTDNWGILINCLRRQRIYDKRPFTTTYTSGTYSGEATILTALTAQMRFAKKAYSNKAQAEYNRPACR